MYSVVKSFNGREGSSDLIGKHYIASYFGDQRIIILFVGGAEYVHDDVTTSNDVMTTCVCTDCCYDTYTVIPESYLLSNSCS